MPEREPYRPSNATEGGAFVMHWCAHCQRDKAMREGEPVEECDDNELCDIIARTMALHPGEVGYPTEWVYGDRDPMCTAFVAAGEPVPERCPHTMDMFA